MAAELQTDVTEINTARPPSTWQMREKSTTHLAGVRLAAFRRTILFDAIMELFQLLGDGKFIASALGVWAMVFLGVTIVGMSLLLGKKLGAIFRV